MLPNNSPWIKQLNRTRPIASLDRNIETNLVIVGGGIAGVVTAFFALRDTKKSVVLLEADKIAHGATGHNAGQITSYFEKPLAVLAEEFGEKLAIEAQRSIESAWLLLDEIILDSKLQTPLYRFEGYTGLTEFGQVVTYLKGNKYRSLGGLFPVSALIAEDWERLKDIPEEYKDFYSIVPKKDILDLLETNNPDFVACLSYQKGCMNSAAFTEELVSYLSTTYPNRFSFYEESFVKNVKLLENSAVLEVLDFKIKAERVVLCTNGFANFSIANEVGKEINTDFHHSIFGRIGYMAGYIEPLDHPPTAISYFTKEKIDLSDPTGDTYFYLTRRPHTEEGESARNFNLICTGGPEKVLPNGALYSRAHFYDEEVRERINDFLFSNYNKHPKDTEYSFCWHGLMGYTPNGIRRVGPEPVNSVLMYNLGCNGVGILPSVYGGKKISQFINNEGLPPSIFDPHDQNVEN